VTGVSGGGQGGGGFYSVPSLTQFGLGGGMGTVPSASPHHDIISAVIAVIEPNSWFNNGGSATISVVRNVLLIRQTPEIHVQIKALLDELSAHTTGGQPLTLDVWWLPLNAKSRRDLQMLLGGDDALSKVSELCESSNGNHGTIRARNRTTANVVSGHRMPLITGNIPVVGHGAVGHQVMVGYVNVGLMAEATVHIDKQQSTAARLILRTAVTNIKNFEDTESTGADIDRFQFRNHVLETVTACHLGKPIIAGSLSVTDEATGANDGVEIVVVVNVTLN
jgi:hypothetical protein